jgi:hypothetical protein
MKTLKREIRTKFAVLFAVLLVAALLAALPFRSRTSAAANTSSKPDLYTRRVPDVNTNLI